MTGEAAAYYEPHLLAPIHKSPINVVTISQCGTYILSGGKSFTLIN